MITEFEQFKTLAGNWIVIIRTSTESNWGPRIWWETDGTGEVGLTRLVESVMRW